MMGPTSNPSPGEDRLLLFDAIYAQTNDLYLPFTTSNYF